MDAMGGFSPRSSFGTGTLALQADAETRRFDPWWRRGDRRRVLSGSPWRRDVVIVDPGGEWPGEECVLAAGVVEVVGGVDECGGVRGVAVGPVGPGVEGVEPVLCRWESVVVVVVAAGELSVDREVVLESVAFGAELGALIEEWLPATGELVERYLGGRDGTGAVGDGAVGRASVESAALGEVAFGLAVPDLCRVEVVGDTGDGAIVWGAVWFEFGELLDEFVDAVLDAGFLALLSFDGGSGVRERSTCVVSEVVEPVRDDTPGLQGGGGWDRGSEVVSGAGGGEVGSVGYEDLFEDVDGVVNILSVGDDADEVLVAAAGDGDVQPATRSGRRREGDGRGGGVGLVAGFGGGVAELDVLGHIVRREGDMAVSVDAGHGEPTVSGDRVDGPEVAVADAVAGGGAEEALVATCGDDVTYTERDVVEVEALVVELSDPVTMVLDGVVDGVDVVIRRGGDREVLAALM